MPQQWLQEAANESAIYMTDGTSEKISVLNFEGKVLAQFGTAGRAAGEMRAAHGIAVDKTGDVWVTEILNWRVQKYARQNK